MTRGTKIAVGVAVVAVAAAVGYAVAEAVGGEDEYGGFGAQPTPPAAVVLADAPVSVAALGTVPPRPPQHEELLAAR